MEVGTMPAQRKTNQSNRLTATGLIAVTAATLLMMGWAIFPTAAFATVPWDGNGVVNGKFKVEQCDDLNTPYIFWIFTGDPGPGLTDVTLTVNGQKFDMDQAGGGNSAWQGTSSFFPLNSITASVDGVGGNLTISHGCPGETTTTTTTTSTTTTPTTTTTTTTPTTTTTTPTTTTTTPTTTTTVPTTTTTTPGGGGGGGGTTTVPTTTTATTVPTVGPTTIHKSTTTTTDEVLATTVKPGGTAFTGVENVVPIGAIALTLLTSGSGLLWAGSRRRRQDGSEDQD
jgi:hypothetical protein